jgi:molybdopterin converting factor small subunit
MKITFSYFAQIRKAAGTESETVSVADGTTVLAALKVVNHGAEFKGLLFDDSGALRPVILLVVNDIPAAPDRKLNDGDHVNVFSPVAGG